MLDLKVMLSPERVEALTRAGSQFAAPRMARGLIDTGASCSSIDVELARLLELERRVVTFVHTPSTGEAYKERSAGR